MSDTNFMSYSDAETVVTGIADKYKTFKGTQAQWDALSLTEKVKYSFADITDDYAGTGVVDEVTNGNMNPVTSNAVYDVMHESFTLASIEGETLAQYLDRFFAGMDRSKITTKSALIVNNYAYRINVILINQVEFIRHSFSVNSSNTTEQFQRYILKPSGSKKFNIVNTIAGVAGSSGVSSTYAINDVSNLTNFDLVTLYY